ncbi:MAG: ATP-binding protein [Sulfuricella sp.]
MNIKQKIWGTLAVTFLIFLIGMAIAYRYSSDTYRLINQANALNYPALQKLTTLTAYLKGIQETLTHAVLTNDRNAIVLAQKKSQQFLKTTQELAAIKGKSVVARKIQLQFEDYYHVAERSASIMLGIKTGEDRIVMEQMGIALGKLENTLKNEVLVTSNAFNTNMSGVEENVRQVMWVSIVNAVLITSSLAGLSYLLLVSIMKNIGYLRTGAQRIAQGNFTQHIPEEGRDELAQVIQVFNTMTDELQLATEKRAQYQKQLETFNLELEARVEQRSRELHSAQSQLQQNEKMASIGVLAAGVAHEINNPVGFIHSNLGTLSRYFDDLAVLIGKYQALRQSVEATETSALAAEIAAEENKIDIVYVLEDVAAIIRESLEGTHRVTRIVKNLKDFSRVDCGETEVANINEGLESTIGILWHELKLKANVIREYGELPSINCYPHELNQVFMNLLINAAQGIENFGEIKIRTHFVRATVNGEPCDGMIEIEISDTGSGIPQDVISKIFDPFFTTKEIGKGTGLGLSISLGIIQKHNGRIDVHSESGVGTAFTIHLPVNGVAVQK